MRTKTMVMLVAGAVLAAGAISCKNPKLKRRGRTVKASIAEFDPNADFEFDLDKYGSELPDDYATQLAFNQAFGGMDACVLKAKQEMGLSTSKTLSGDVEVAVMLDPKRGRPSAVNATLPKRYRKNKDLKDCIREAVGTVEFPKYDGVPRQADFRCELDAGTEAVDDDW